MYHHFIHQTYTQRNVHVYFKRTYHFNSLVPLFSYRSLTFDIYLKKCCITCFEERNFSTVLVISIVVFKKSYPFKWKKNTKQLEKESDF